MVLAALCHSTSTATVAILVLTIKTAHSDDELLGKGC